MTRVEIETEEEENTNEIDTSKYAVFFFVNFVFVVF